MAVLSKEYGHNFTKQKMKPDPISPQNGDEQTINGKPSVYYDGYWMRRYDAPKHLNDSYEEKRKLIKMLTKRVFRNIEAGMNTPGYKLDAARQAYDNCQNNVEKRVHAGMLAGALLNRATDILTHVVELQKDGVHIVPQNELIRQCGKNLMEALELGKQVKHYSGCEGIDELWGEPFKAFSLSMEDFYKSRYQKIAHALQMIDDIALLMMQIAHQIDVFNNMDSKIKDYAHTANQVVETAKNDPVFLTLWPKFVACSESILNYPNIVSESRSSKTSQAFTLIKSGNNLIKHITSARVTMPKSYAEYQQACEEFIQSIS